MTTFQINGQTFTADPTNADELYEASEAALDVLMQIVDDIQDMPRAQRPDLAEIIAARKVFGSGDWHIALQEGREVSCTIGGITYTVTVS